MQSRVNQRGIGFWGLIMVAALIVFFTLMFFKLLPPYIENAKIKTALENVSRQPNAINMEKNEIKAALDRRFSIEDINDVDLNKVLFVEKKPGVTTIRITYERRVPIAYNVIALLEFNDSVQFNARLVEPRTNLANDWVTPSRTRPCWRAP